MPNRENYQIDLTFLQDQKVTVVQAPPIIRTNVIKNVAQTAQTGLLASITAIAATGIAAAGIPKSRLTTSRIPAAQTNKMVRVQPLRATQSVPRATQRVVLQDPMSLKRSDSQQIATMKRAAEQSLRQNTSMPTLRSNLKATPIAVPSKATPISVPSGTTPKAIPKTAQELTATDKLKIAKVKEIKRVDVGEPRSWVETPLRRPDPTITISDIEKAFEKNRPAIDKNVLKPQTSGDQTGSKQLRDYVDGIEKDKYRGDDQIQGD